MSSYSHLFNVFMKNFILFKARSQTATPHTQFDIGNDGKHYHLPITFIFLFSRRTNYFRFLMQHTKVLAVAI